MSNNAIPDASRPHEVTITFWVPEDRDPRDFIRSISTEAEMEGAEVVSDDWEDV